MVDDWQSRMEGDMNDKQAVDRVCFRPPGVMEPAACSDQSLR
jgi:hypothetical protein